MDRKAKEYDGSTPLANARWERFAGHIVTGAFPDYECVTLAGYTTKKPACQAVRLQTYEKVSRRIAYLKNQVALRAVIDTSVDRAYIVKGFKNVAERCQQAEPVLDSKGKPTGVYKFDSAGANGALDKLAKIEGIYADPSEGAPRGDITYNVVVFNGSQPLPG